VKNPQNMAPENPEQPMPARKSKRAQWNIARQVYMVLLAGAVLATLFTAFSPLGLFPSGLAQQLGNILNGSEEGLNQENGQQNQQIVPRIGIVAGHWGNDSGAVCDDGLTEVEINLNVATRVQDNLVALGFEVDLLEEFDDRLDGYEALTVVSIHADTCSFIDENASGFKVAAALASENPEQANRLVACIRERYSSETGLTRHPSSATADMTSNHAFEEIHPDSTAAIIELGFMNLDRQILTNQPELLAAGITRGITCYIFNEDASGNN